MPALAGRLWCAACSPISACRCSCRNCSFDPFAAAAPAAADADQHADDHQLSDDGHLLGSANAPPSADDDLPIAALPRLICAVTGDFVRGPDDSVRGPGCSVRGAAD